MNPASPLVSFIVVNYNGAAYIGETLRALQDQTLSACETIVVDNDSRDDSPALIARDFSTVILLKTGRNLGFAGGNNVGLAEARGKYIALVNNDVVLDRRWAEVMVAEAEANPKTGLFASKVYLAGTDKLLNSTGTLVYPDLTNLNRGMREKDTGQYDAQTDVFGPYGAAALLRKGMLDTVGGFDDDYFMHREEDDLAWRCRLAGWNTLFVPTALAWHKWSAASGGGGSLFKLYYGERNRIRNVIKYLPADLMLASLFLTLKRLWALSRVPAGPAGAKRIKVSKFSIIRTLLKAWLHGWLGLPRYLGKRRRIRPQRARVKALLARYPATLEQIRGFYTN